MSLSTHNSPTTHSPTVSVWTPSGRGAVATVRVVGRFGEHCNKLFRAATHRELSDLPLDRLCFGQWGNDPVEDVVICRDSHESFEVHCHGGHAAVQRIVSDLTRVGCERVDWPTQWSSANEAEREFADALSQATTMRTAAWIVEQTGRLSAAISQLQRFAAAGQRDEILAMLDGILRWSQFGRHLTQPWSVVLAGRPNVGKSSLINALVGYERSIVFDQPGTTRDVVTAETVFDGWPIRLSDTAGQRGSADELESSGIARAREALSVADCPVLVIDVSQAPQRDDFQLLQEWPQALIVAHKIDLPNRWLEQLPSQAISVSSLQRTGLSELSNEIVQRLIPELPPSDAVIPLTNRQHQTFWALRESVLAASNRDNLAATLAPFVQSHF
jgi:tRNA modification GTPase